MIGEAHCQSSNAVSIPVGSLPQQVLTFGAAPGPARNSSQGAYQAPLSVATQPATILGASQMHSNVSPTYPVLQPPNGAVSLTPQVASPGVPNLSQEELRLIAEHAAAKNHDEREVISKKLNEHLAENFDKTIKNAQDELKQLEAKLEIAKAKLQRRIEKKSAIVEARLKVILNEKDELAWDYSPIESPNPQAGLQIDNRFSDPIRFLPPRGGFPLSAPVVIQGNSPVLPSP